MIALYNAQGHILYSLSRLAPTVTSPERVEAGATVNLAQAAQLGKTEYIELAEFNVDLTSASPDKSPYSVIQTIRDPATIRQITAALDQPIMVGMAPACIAQYEVRFYRSDRVLATFAYMCRDDKPLFIRGWTSDESFHLGGEVQLSPAVRDTLQPYLSAAPSK
jgi:hypothetical protein